MGRDVELSCRCGKVHGLLRNASRSTVNRCLCYCEDCRGFLHHLGRADLLDAHGGTEIIQVAPAALAFDRGTEEIRAVRLGPKGLFRWYAECCKTPLGNTMKPSLPFVGIAHELFRGAPDGARRDEVFGRPRGAVHGKQAIGEPPPGSTKPNVPMMAHLVRLMLGWKIGGKAWPHPYFDRATGEPRYPVTVLSREERDALRR